MFALYISISLFFAILYQCSTFTLLHSHSLHRATRIFTIDENSNRIDETTMETFLEQESRDGTEKIKSLSIEERTKRAMLAEAVEDSLSTLHAKLEKLVGDDGKPLKGEYKDQIVELANLIKASENDYHLLVSGKESPLLNVLDD